MHGLRQLGPGGRQAFFEEAQREGFIDNMVGDWEAALACVRNHLHVGNGLLGYFGLSMGTIFGLPLLGFAERHADMEIVVAVIGLCGTSGAGAETAGRLRGEAQITRMPVTLLMQMEDELFPRHGYWDLFDALGSADKRLHANPGLHPEVPAEAIDFAFDFLLQRLTGTVARQIVYPLAD